MDDSEYYSLMNRSSCWNLNQILKNKNKNNDSKKNIQKEVQNFNNVITRQGKADAEMLLEKNENE